MYLFVVDSDEIAKEGKLAEFVEQTFFWGCEDYLSDKVVLVLGSTVRFNRIHLQYMETGAWEC